MGSSTSPLQQCCAGRWRGVRYVRQQSCSRALCCRRFLPAAAGDGRAALPARASACALETLQVPLAMVLRVRLMLQHEVGRVSAAAVLTGWAGRGGVGVAAQACRRFGEYACVPIKERCRARAIVSRPG